MGKQYTVRSGKARLRRQSVASLVLALAWLLLLPQIAVGSVVVSNYMVGEVAPPTAGPLLFGYHQGTTTTFDLQADFDQGVYASTEVDPTGTFLQLASAPSITWWDTDWGARRCFDITNSSTTALTEHQVRIVFDSTADDLAGLVQADGADYRAVAADNMTEHDLWVESGIGTAETVVWVQTDLAAAATTNICLYFDNSAAPTVSSQANVFTYTAPQQLYFPTYWRFDGSNGNNGSLDIVSFVDNNVVTVDGDARMLDAGQSALYTNVTEDSTITVLGPISGRGRGGGMDSIVPLSFAGTDMVFPTNRSNQRWTIVSPSGANAAVQIFNGTTLAWSGTVGGTAQVIDANVTGGRSGIIRSDIPIIVTHAASNNSQSDSLVVPPFFAGDDLYGVRSRSAFIGFDGAGSVDVYRSDGSMQTISGGAGSVQSINVGSDLDGNGTAERLTNMVTTTGGLQQADRDGFESTAYLPERLLESEYYLPSAADYIAFSCPTAMNIFVGATSVPCGTFGPLYPGHGWHAAAPQGTRITSDTGEPFFAYYEDSRNDDETNLFGMKSAQAPAVVEPTIVGGSLELLPAGPTVGTWTSPVIDTTAVASNVFGLLTTAASIASGDDVTIQVARGGDPFAVSVAPFLGPDGTAATSFGTGEVPAPFAWDFGDEFVVVRITLTTATPGQTPTVDLFSLGYDLPALSRSSSHTVVTSGTTADSDWVVRVWAEDPVLSAGSATLYHLNSSGIPAAGAATIHIESSAQVIISSGSVSPASPNPVMIGPGLPHNVSVDTTDMMGADVTVVWQGALSGGTTVIPHQLDLTFN